MFEACIFDLDGTLVDSLRDLADSVNQALKAMGFPPHEVDSYRYFVGRGAARLVETVLPEGERSPENLLVMRRLFNEYYAAHYLDNTRPYKGINELLVHLQARGMKLAVVSNKPQGFVDKIVDHLFPGVFAAVVGQREGVPTKPDPAGVFEACQVMGVGAQNCLYLGDSGIDMETALAAGAFPIGVLWGFRSKEELVSAGAQALLVKPSEFEQVLYRLDKRVSNTAVQ